MDNTTELNVYKKSCISKSASINSEHTTHNTTAAQN